MKQWFGSLIVAFIVGLASATFMQLLFLGLYWVFYAVGGVVFNDIGAHALGIVIGKTKLIKLSPKKTVEGFFAGSLFAYAWILILSLTLSQTMFFVCPQDKLFEKPFVQVICEIPDFISNKG